MDIDLPKIDESLIKWLEYAYSDKIVTAEQSAYEQGKLHGNIEVVRRIKEIYESEEE